MSINIRFRKTSHGLYSAYLDVYSKGQREYYHPDIIVTEDYSQAQRDRQGNLKKDASGKLIYPKIKPEDKEKMKSLEIGHASVIEQLELEFHANASLRFLTT